MIKKRIQEFLQDDIWLTIFNPKSKSKFRINTFKLLKATIIGQLITVSTIPVISRLYSPSSIGILAVFIAISSIFTVIICFRYEMAIVLPKEDEEAINVLVLSLIIILLMTIGSLLIVIFFKEQIGDLLKTPQIKPWLIFLPLSLFANGMYNSFNYWATRNNRFGIIAVSRISQSSSSAIYKILYGLLLTAKTETLIIGQVLGQVVSAFVLFLQCFHKDFMELMKKISLPRIIDGAIKHKNFPLYSSWSAILNVLSMQIPSVLLAFFFAPKIVAYYALGFKLLGTPLSFINQSVAQVFYQKISEVKNSGNSVSNIYWKMLKVLFFLSILPTVILMFFGKIIFIIFLGSMWAEAGLYAQILAPLLLFRLVAAPVSSVLLVYNKQVYDSIFNVFMFVLTVISISIGGILKNPIISMAGMSISLSLSYLLLLALQIKVIKS